MINGLTCKVFVGPGESRLCYLPESRLSHSSGSGLEDLGMCFNSWGTSGLYYAAANTASMDQARQELKQELSPGTAGPVLTGHCSQGLWMCPCLSFSFGALVLWSLGLGSPVSKISWVTGGSVFPAPPSSCLQQAGRPWRRFCLLFTRHLNTLGCCSGTITVLLIITKYAN